MTILEQTWWKITTISSLKHWCLSICLSKCGCIYWSICVRINTNICRCRLVAPPSPTGALSTRVDWSSHTRASSRQRGPLWVGDLILAVNHDGSMYTVDASHYPRPPGGVPSHSMRLFISVRTSSLPPPLSPSLPSHFLHLSPSHFLAFPHITSLFPTLPRISLHFQPFLHYSRLLSALFSTFGRGAAYPRALTFFGAPHKNLGCVFHHHTRFCL